MYMSKKSRFHVGCEVIFEGKKCIIVRPFDWAENNYRQGTYQEAWWIRRADDKRGLERDVYASELILSSDDIQKKLE